MKKTNFWNKAQNVKLQVSENIKPEFDIGFDNKIPEDVKDEMRSFVEWVEQNYSIPITLWVDFEYRHYLVKRDGKRVGWIIYYSDFDNYPVFENFDDIPQIRLPVRTEHWTIEEILMSFIEAMFCYYAWICNEVDKYELNEEGVDEILQLYLDSKK